MPIGLKDLSRRFVTTTVIGILFAGVLGNALWDLGKPLFFGIVNALVTVSTLGMQALIDNVYVEVAKGSYERAGTMLLAAATGICLGTTSFVIVGLLFPRIFLSSKGLVADEDVAKSMIRIPYSKTMVTLTLAALVLVVLQAAQVNYVIRASRLLEQLQIIDAPYLTSEQRIKFASRGAQIASRKDYVAIVDELQEIGRTHAARLPAAAVW